MRKFDMRRWGAVLLSACLLGGCAQAGDQQEPAASEEKISLYDRGLTVIKKMDMMAESDSYMDMMGGSPEVLEVVSEMGGEDYSRPEKVWKVTMPQSAMDSLFDANGISMDSVPQELQPDLERRVVEAVPTVLGTQAGVSFLAAMSLVTVTDYFIDQELGENTVYFYIYEGAYSGAVVFSAHEDGIVAATGRFISNEILGENEDGDELGRIFAVSGLAGVEISEVSPQ